MKILHRYTGAVLWESPCSTMHETVAGAIKANADLSYADLRYADLRSANLSSANLRSANLRSADLSSANLRSADLSSADLRSANLRSADLRYANLRSADLSYADLRYADLSSADLRYADLSSADLSYAKGLELVIAKTRILSAGDLIGWKKCCEGVIVKLKIPSRAKRSHAFGRKCRAQYADVLQVIGGKVGISQHDSKTKYAKGKRVKCDQWCDDWQQECAGGIHFYITRKEAEAHE
jgi:hypothetical protein